MFLFYKKHLFTNIKSAILKLFDRKVLDVGGGGEENSEVNEHFVYFLGKKLTQLEKKHLKFSVQAVCLPLWLKKI